MALMICCLRYKALYCNVLFFILIYLVISIMSKQKVTSKIAQSIIKKLSKNEYAKSIEI